MESAGGERVRELEERLRIISEALREFAEATTDYDRLLEVIARKLSTIVKDGCVVRLLSDDGWLRPAAIHLPIEERVPDPQTLAQIRAHVAATRHVSEQSTAKRVLETGEALLVPSLSPRQVAAGATPEIVQVFETIGIHSLLFIALRVHGESLGLLSLVRFSSPASFTEQDRELAQALADHAALAIANSRLLQTARHELAERERAEAALRHTEQQLRYTLDSIGDAVIAADADGRVSRMNPVAETLTGWRREEGEGRPLAEVFRVDPVEFPFVESSRPGHADHILIARDGQRRPIAASRAPLRDHAGETGGVVLAFRDVTAERRAEEERLRAIELAAENRRIEEATRLKSIFLANMSHEMRTPLNAIMGFSELLADEEVGPLSLQQREFLGNVLVGSRHLMQLINDVLDLSKVEAGKMDFRPESIDPRDLLGEVAALLQPLADNRGVRLLAHVEPGLTTIVVDPGRTKQVLYNLLSNALKFTAAGGNVEARILKDGSDRFRIEVADTGIGIAAEDLPRLFVEFQQLDHGTASPSPGTGLGLALTRRLVEAQGGEIGVTSAVGKGSVFHATLPRGVSGQR